MSRISLPGISSLAWEHPADRAALNTLRAIPGFDDVVRKIAGFFGERGLRHLFLANAVRVGPNQRPKLNALYDEVIATFEWPRRPELYVTQTPFVNAGAVGFEDPFIIINSGTLGLLSRERPDMMPLDAVSHGTRDQVALLLRLARRRPPRESPGSRRRASPLR